MLVNISRNKIFLWRPFVFSSLCISIESDLFPDTESIYEYDEREKGYQHCSRDISIDRYGWTVIARLIDMNGLG